MGILTRVQRAVLRWMLKAAFPNPVPQRVHIGRWTSDGDILSQEASGYEDYARVYENYIWVRVAIDKNAANFASVPVQVVDAEGVAIKGHPVSQLFQMINPAMSYIDLWQSWMIDMMLAGEAFWEVVKNGRGVPVELWPRRPDKMGVVPDADNKRFLAVAGYKFDRGTDVPLDFEPDDIVHFKFYNPLNPWRGLRPIAAARQGILIDIFAQTWTKMLFQRGARPDYAIQLPEGQRLTPSMLQERQAYIDEKFRGVEKAHGIMILEHGEQVVPFSWDPADMQYLEQRKTSRDEVGAIFGVPDEVMGFGRNTYENYSFAWKAYWQGTLFPLLRHRDEAATKFLRRIGALKSSEWLVSDVSEVQALQQDINEQIEGAYKLWTMGTPANMAYQAVGLDLVVPGGSTAYLPFNLVPVGAVGQQQPEERDISTEMLQKGLPLEYGGPAHQALWKSFVALTTPREKKIQRELKRQFQRQQNEVGRRLREWGEQRSKGQETKLAVEVLIDQEEEERIFEETFGPFIEEMFAAAAAQAIEELELGIDFDLNNSLVQEAIEDMIIRFAKQPNQTTIDALRRELAEGSAAGESIPQLMERVSRVFEGRKSDYQTERIARTEMVKAANAGHIAAYEQSGVVQGKEWLAALDDRTREAHVAAHGQRVPLKADFEVGGEYLYHPGDPKGSPGNIINCR